MAHSKAEQCLFSSLCISISIVTIFLSSQNVIVNGQMNYTEKERNALEKFRGLVDDVLTQDFQMLDSYLFRWLKARNFDAAQASEFFRRNAKWRRDNKIDSILNETIFTFDPPVYTNDAFDYGGHPVVTFTPTRVNLRQLVASGKRDKVVRYWDQIMEESERRLELASTQSDGKLYQGIAMLDLIGFNPRQHACIGCIGTFVDFILHYENYHPEMATHVIFINTPRVFIPIFELIRPFLSPTTRKALKVLESNKLKWSAFIHQIIPPDQLTLQFGGTRKN